MSDMKLPAAILAAAAALSAMTGAARAQQLSDADYALCAVYDRDDDFVGYDSVCLERKRAQLRRYQRKGGGSYASAGYAGAYSCPAWANNGNGYPGTVYSDGGPPSTDPYGSYDRPVDGVRCLPKPVYYGTGYY